MLCRHSGLGVYGGGRLCLTQQKLGTSVKLKEIILHLGLLAADRLEGAPGHLVLAFLSCLIPGPGSRALPQGTFGRP